MDTRQGRTLESLRSVQGFLDVNADHLPGIATSGQRKTLDDLVIVLDGHVSTQSGSTLTAQGATQKHQSLREALIRDHMAPIAQIAAAADLPKTPELEALKMPRLNSSIERLRAAAMGMAKAAAPFADVFVQAALPADFIDQLVAAANATIVPVGTRKQNKVTGAAATKGLSTTLTNGRKAVHALDALVKSAFKDQPALLAGWRTAKRVEVFKGPKLVPTKPATSTTTAAPTSATIKTPAVPAATTTPSATPPVAAQSTTITTSPTTPASTGAVPPTKA